MKDIKLLALDMDGTVYYNMGHVIKENIEPIQSAIEQGVEVVFVTGRPVHSRPNQIIENGFAKKDGTVIVGYNGGAIYDVFKKTILKKHTIKADLAQKAFELAERPEFKGSIVWGYVDDLQTTITNVIDPANTQDKIQAYLNEMNFFDGEYVEWKDVQANFNFEFFKMLAFDARPGFLEALADLGFEVAIDHGNNSEVNAPGINKAHALKWLSQELNIDPKNIMAVGDGYNDISMIKFVGYGVSMENSVDDLKKIADLHMPLTNEQGAVSEIIRQYILKK
ncbi:haloacid dehalogenase [Williamsoniiplasma luminosum]|uniref:Haloacid dehalogenase n=1 Tax=Williamsoniiplasma luminosum TaxID=214888 RepID=A0A2K8NVL3_9MOLU|nr:Cof-type HAD-IIB family hydrolase [Williamsoniiplasma luminosum]ATZ17586.1 haloacid dehalogenase [Williamsoniiplasma luminosum]